MRRFIFASIIAISLVSAGSVVNSQQAGVALAAFGSGSVFDGWIGPFKPTATGVDFAFSVLCYESGSRRKEGTEIVISAPDGTSLVQLRSLITTGIVNACASQGITVSRNAVLMPSMQFGQ